MSAISRDIRVRVATPGATAVDGNVAITLSLAELGAVPVAFGTVLHPIDGGTEMRPFSVAVLDKDEVLAGLTENERWALIGRLVDVQHSDDGGGWVTYGTGRVTHLDEEGGPGEYRLEVSDESWKTRRAGIFHVADTTQLWPTTIKSWWRGWEPLGKAVGRIADGVGSVSLVELTAGEKIHGGGTTLDPGGQEVIPPLVTFIENDVIDNPRVRPDALSGNFRHLRLNYDGVDYEVVTLGMGMPGIVGQTADSATSNGPTGAILETLKAPQILAKDYLSSPLGEAATYTSDPLPYGRGRLVRIFAWIVGAPAVGSTAPAYLHAPTAPPSEDNPLHIGIRSDTHPWGSPGGTGGYSGGLHVATLTRRVWEALDVVFDSADLATLEADSSLPRLWLRVTENPANIEEWLQEFAWGPNLLAPLKDGTGKRRLVDMRIPQNVDPFALPVFNASNAASPTWRLVGRDAINAVKWRYLHTERPPTSQGSADIVGKVLADGLILEERDWPVIEGDTIDDVGERSVSLTQFGAMEPTADELRLFYALGGVVFKDLAEANSRDIFELFQDGPVTGSLEIARADAETLSEGDLIVLDQDSLHGPNPAAAAARTGFRVARALSVSRHSAFAVVEYLDMGPRVQPLAPPLVYAAQSGDNVSVSIGAIPAGASVLIECAYTATTDAPLGFPFKRDYTSGDPAVVFGAAPGSGYAHVRARTSAPGRIRSPWTSVIVALETRPLIQDLSVLIGPTGVPLVRGRGNTHVAGVVIQYAVTTGARSKPKDWILAYPSDYSEADFELGIALLDAVVARKHGLCWVRVVPWSGFGGGGVSGTAGPGVVTASARTLFERPLIPTIEVKTLNTYVSPKDEEGLGEDKDQPGFPTSPVPKPKKKSKGVMDEPLPLGSSSAGIIIVGPDGKTEVDIDRIDFNKLGKGKGSCDIQLTIRDTTSAGGLLYIWTNKADAKSADFKDDPDDILTIDSVPAQGKVIEPEDSPALSRVPVPLVTGTKRMYFRYDSNSGATSGLVPPFDEGMRLGSLVSADLNDGTRRGFPGRGGFDTGYDEKLALIEEMHRDFLAGFVGERYLNPSEIRSADGLFTLMDGEGNTIKNLVIEDTVTDEGLRTISLFLAKPSSSDPDDLDGVSDGAVFRRVISIDSDGLVTAASIKAGVITGFHINVGQLSELTDDLGILVNGQLIGTGVLLDLGASGSDPIIDSANLYILANGDAGFAGTITLDGPGRGDKIEFIDVGQITGFDFPVVALAIDSDGILQLTAVDDVNILATADIDLTATNINLDAAADITLWGAQVSFGAADSAGSGFRLVQVPN